MDFITAYLEWINGQLWGKPMLVALGLTGLLLMISLRFMPLRKIPTAFGMLFKRSEGEGSEESRAALEL